MSIYTTGELHEVADKLLEAIKTVPAADRMSESAGNWIGLDKVESRIHKHRKQTHLRIDNETFLLCIGLLVGRGDLECNRAHGRGVGYFFMVRLAEKESE